MLGHLVHGADRGRDLLDGRSLLAAFLGDAVDQCRVGADTVQHGAELGRGIGHEARTAADFVGRLLDQRLDLARGLGGRLGETPHFHGDHRKALPGFTGARRFHRGVERQEVCLEGDVVDQPDDIADLARRGRDLLHRAGRLSHHCFAVFGGTGHRRGIVAGVRSALRVLQHGGCELFHRRRGFFDGRCLLGRAFGEVVRTREDFASGVLERARHFLELSDNLGELFGHRIGIVLELAEGTRIVAVDALGELRAGNGREHGAGFAEAAIDGLDQRIDAAGESVELGIREFRRDALGEIAGDSRVDHITKGALQFLHHLRPGFLVTDDPGRFRFGHRGDLEPILAEDFHGARHHADFVDPIEARHGDRVVASGHRIDGLAKILERPADHGPHQEVKHDAGDGDADHRNRDNGPNGIVDGGLERGDRHGRHHGPHVPGAAGLERHGDQSPRLSIDAGRRISLDNLALCRGVTCDVAERVALR